MPGPALCKKGHTYGLPSAFLKTASLGTGLEHILISQWFTTSRLLILRVLSALVESQGTRFTETTPPARSTILTMQGMCSFHSGGGLFLALLGTKNNLYPGAHINIAPICLLLSPKVTRSYPDVSRGGMSEHQNHEGDIWFFLSVMAEKMQICLSSVG